MTKQTDFDRYQEELRKKTWSMADIPFYEKGEVPNISKLETLDFLDTKEKIFGRKFGRNGIGKLREVALSEVAEQELYSDHPLFKQDPQYFLKTGLGGGEHPDIEKWQAQQKNFIKVLEENGVKVHIIEYPKPFMGPYGPMLVMWAASDLMITRGGIISQRGCMYPFGGYLRFDYLARWANWHLNIPILLTITGKGICEANPVSHFLAEDVMVVGLSAACNEEGLNQLVSAVERTSGVEDFELIVNRMAQETYWDPESGTGAHLDMMLHAVDVGKVLVYPPSINTDVFRWLRAHKFEIITVDRDEQVTCFPCNLILLEPGKVILHEGATKTASKLRKAGVEVIEIPWSECLKMGGGLHCSTMEIYREPGPHLKDII
jgi:N-dimethylarginine dimethylaminohydrolase